MSIKCLFCFEIGEGWQDKELVGAEKTMKDCGFLNECGCPLLKGTLKRRADVQVEGEDWAKCT